MRKYTEFRGVRYATYRHKKQQHADAVITLDSESTSYFLVNGEWVTDDGKHDLTQATDRRAVLYIWQMCINGECYYGRTLDELRQFLLTLSAQFGGNIATIFVHNLGFDFEFIAPLFAGWEVFARKAHKPIYARLPPLSLEFRCSYFLTGQSLATAAKSVGAAHQKKAGDLDYSTARLPCTPLTERELGYCEFDVLSLYDIICHYRDKYGTIANIPYTQTGEVRRVVKKILNNYNYLQKIHTIQNNFDNYRHLTRLFMGGVTHLNYLYNGDIVEDVKSFDRRSSYPAVMCLEQYPFSAFTPCDDISQRDYYCYYARISIEGLQSRSAWDYISIHKCEVVRGGLTDNGKLFRAEYVEMWATDVDIDIIRDTYKGDLKIIECYRAVKAYLPLDFVRYILQLYSDKTTLKNVTGREADYLKSKQFINSLYGMTVTNNIRADVDFADEGAEWTETELTDEQIRERLAADKPFLHYSVGVWVTAYARRELFAAINKIGNDCVYCDTDSVKIINADEWQSVIDEYNRDLYAKIDRVCELRGLPREQFFPVAPDGTVCPLGEFALDGVYKRFKSFGAKKYAYEDEHGHFSAVVAGCKKTWTEFLPDGTTRERETIRGLDDFTAKSVYPHGRSVCWYVQQQPATELTDKDGRHYTTPEGAGGVVIADSNYTMGLSADYMSFLANPNSTNNRLTNIYRTKL